jgi:hypothetical protein
MRAAPQGGGGGGRLMTLPADQSQGTPSDCRGSPRLEGAVGLFGLCECERAQPCYEAQLTRAAAGRSSLVMNPLEEKYEY